MCGEKMMKAGSNCAMLGSPPRMRGKAGFHTYCTFLNRDHPRVCGEKGAPFRWGSRWRGSPPRMRGKVKLVHLAPVLVGITPAYAGKR